jgi:diguanylate cyclase (GGDEF)-like protein/PAS domain S-box-containing protein
MSLPSSADAGLSSLDNIYFRQLFENSPEAIVLLDNEDRVIDANPSFEQLFDYTVAEARGRRVNSLIVPEEMAEQASGLSEDVLNGQIVSAETVRRRKDGTRVSVWVLGYPIAEGARQVGIFGIYRDITIRKRFERKLKLQSAAMNSAANAIFITDYDGRIEWANRAFGRLSGYTEAEVTGRTPQLLDPGWSGEGLDPVAWHSLQPNEVWRGRVVSRSKNGRLYNVEQTVTPLGDPRTGVSHFVVVQEDISERIEAEDRLHRMARRDSLTGLPNRYSFNERLKLELERISRSGSMVAVLVLDLDHFKDVNDSYGHPMGDELLIAVSKRLRGTLRETNALARLGGDEFAVIQTDLTDPENARGLASRLLDIFRRPFALGGQEIHTSASIGIAVYPPGDAEPRSLVKKADLAMYRAKEEGRGTFRFYEAEMDRRVQQRMKLGQDLHGALERRELFLRYQPQIELSNRSIVGVEALIRWRHSELGLVPPDVFIPIAEGSGLIIQLGKWVLRQACIQARAWHDGMGLSLPVAVNLSAVQFRDIRFLDSVVEILQETGLDGNQLQLELTEGILMQPNPSVEKALEGLCDLGVQLSLDDFGKGYSSLEYLRRLPLKRLKIDRSFVRGLSDGAHDPVIVSVVMALGKQLGLEVVAEGIETRSQLEFLHSEGCSVVQGYYFSKPVSAEEIGRLLVHGGKRITPASPSLEEGEVRGSRAEAETASG